MGVEYGGTLQVEYVSDSTQDSPFSRADVMERALQDWRAFTGNPEDTLPWNTSMAMAVTSEGDWVANVLIRWERAT